MRWKCLIKIELYDTSLLSNLRSSFFYEFVKVLWDFLSCVKTQTVYAGLWLEYLIELNKKNALDLSSQCWFNPICINCKAISRFELQEDFNWIIKKFFIPELELRSSFKTRQREKKKYPITILTLHLRASDTSKKKKHCVRKKKSLSTNFPWRNFQAMPNGISPKSRRGKSAVRENVTDLNI